MTNNDDFQIGDPIMCVFRGARIYGHVAGFAGTEYHGAFPVIILRTPHGSEVRSGRAWVWHVTSEADQAILANFVAQAACEDEKIS